MLSISYIINTLNNICNCNNIDDNDDDIFYELLNTPNNLNTNINEYNRKDKESNIYKFNQNDDYINFEINTTDYPSKNLMDVESDYTECTKDNLSIYEYNTETQLSTEFNNHISEDKYNKKNQLLIDEFLIKSLTNNIKLESLLELLNKQNNIEIESDSIDESFSEHSDTNDEDFSEDNIDTMNERSSEDDNIIDENFSESKNIMNDLGSKFLTEDLISEKYDNLFADEFLLYSNPYYNITNSFSNEDELHVIHLMSKNNKKNTVYNYNRFYNIHNKKSNNYIIY